MAEAVSLLAHWKLLGVVSCLFVNCNQSLWGNHLGQLVWFAEIVSPFLSREPFTRHALDNAWLIESHTSGEKADRCNSLSLFPQWNILVNHQSAGITFEIIESVRIETLQNFESTAQVSSIRSEIY